jgi:cytochrome b
MKSVLVWDLPLRLFHWSLVALVVASIASGLIGGNWMEWHGRFGVAIAGLLAFRVAWGFLGSTHARFLSFIRGPRTVVAYLSGKWHGLGHNPLGALSVMALLTALAAQVVTGLIGNDDIAFNGPLYALVDKATSDMAIAWHKTIIWVLATLIALHLTALLFYTKVRREKLIGPMVHGHREVVDPNAADAVGGGSAALLLAVAIGIAASWAAAGGLLPPPPPPPPAGSGFNW